jgi:hypothetical protein
MRLTAMSAALALTATASPALAADIGSGSAGRPILLGLLAALFLVMGAIVGDKHAHHKPKSRR